MSGSYRSVSYQLFVILVKECILDKTLFKAELDHVRPVVKLSITREIDFVGASSKNKRTYNGCFGGQSFDKTSIEVTTYIILGE